ncbi:MAG: 23S rRNA pseudouridine(955/2504/2580) synthase RluC [Legionellales bacterium]|nr:23S rRNA pseudouridine(955/2504/2580) synthase RluC [Legionellales bacterium]
MSENQVQYKTISASEAGQRIDNYLLKICKSAPRSLIYRIIRKGEVRVNKKRIKPLYRLCAGDEVRVPPLRLSEINSLTPQISACDKIRQRIIYEDDEMIAINKPSGMAVHGGSGIQYGAIETLRALYPELQLELVHRLDRDTSGILLIAKKRSSLLFLQQQFVTNKINKEYSALVKGRWLEGKRQVNVPLRKNTLQSGERMVIIAADGKPSCTDFIPKQLFKLASLLTVRLHTGRTHQIRVHATHIGFPLAGDDKYGDKAFNREMKTYGLHRLFLHAEQLTFTHPKTAALMTLTAPLADELTQCLSRLE